MKIAAIIPAYNEETNIRRIIHVLQKIDIINEIIVVNDGSIDRTAEIVAEELGVILINLRENVGKGGAIKAGLSKTKADIVLLLDADLIGLRKEHIYNLLNPVIKEAADATFGVFKEGRPATDFALLLAPQLSGQRAIRRELIEDVDIEKTGFGVEIAILKHLESKDAVIKEVELYNLTHHTKEEKLGLIKGFKARLNMYYEVIKILFGG